ncbi:MAG TPA: hypothetical protein DEA43_00930 [Candidatus Moranbacteria bacterium]|nr:hypothetical protein [Candidatus Moranbacteria bacterium]HBT45433.1 hypothetical protein [Candidatus Moranbacteria bacterium]
MWYTEVVVRSCFFVSPVSSFGTLLAESYGQSLLPAISQPTASRENRLTKNHMLYMILSFIDIFLKKQK